MKLIWRILVTQLLLLPFLVPLPGLARSFRHIVIIFQENRTPDNLFQGLCNPKAACGTPPQAGQYNILTANWLNKNSQTGMTQPFRVPLANKYSPGHDHRSWAEMCDRDHESCRMDGAANDGCTGECPPNAQFAYVDNTEGIVGPYLTLAKQYGWANYMFQTNQGPSYPAHQFIFGATSARSATDDKQGTFVAENGSGGQYYVGCATSGTRVQLIDADGQEDPNNRIFPCFEHGTISDIVSQAGLTWRYYTPGQNHIWSAPNSIDHICVASGGKCTGSDWVDNVDIAPRHVLADIQHCNLRNLSWVIPAGQNSDHPLMNSGGGPSWVAAIVNAIGNSDCTDGSTSYWLDTAIVITWDDWGGWYDHVPPTILKYPQGGYQYGFRVPLIFVSAYTPAGYISNTHQDFGAIARFIERNFGIKLGSLGFADARTGANLSTYYDFNRQPRTFQTIPARFDARHFIDDTSPPLPPDDD